LEKALDGKPVTIENLSALDQRDIWIIPGFGRKTADEIAAWAARHGVTMPENKRWASPPVVSRARHKRDTRTNYIAKSMLHDRL
jgi:hypothetical protein